MKEALICSNSGIETYIRFSKVGFREGGWFFIFWVFKSILFFVNWISLYFFHFLWNMYYQILFIIVFKLGSDKLVFCFFYCLSQWISPWMWLLASEGGWYFIFDHSGTFYFLFTEFHYAFSISFIELACYGYYYFIW